MDNKIKLSVKEITDKLFHSGADADFMELLQHDERKAVQRLLVRYDKELKEKERLHELYKYEYAFEQKGFKYIAGTDEAGRGPLAGPVVAAAVILPIGCYIPRLNDSKKLSASAREKIYGQILAKAISVSRAIIDEKTIDRINIYQASMNAMYEAIYKLDVKPQQVLIDAMPLNALDIPHLSIIKGDAKSASIAAASIVAKVERDHLMDEYAKQYPEYDFSSHKGYGTKKHIEALRKYGPCPLHRRSFEPVKSMIS